MAEISLVSLLSINIRISCIQVQQLVLSRNPLDYSVLEADILYFNYYIIAFRLADIGDALIQVCTAPARVLRNYAWGVFWHPPVRAFRTGPLSVHSNTLMVLVQVINEQELKITELYKVAILEVNFPVPFLVDGQCYFSIIVADEAPLILFFYDNFIWHAIEVLLALADLPKDFFKQSDFLIQWKELLRYALRQTQKTVLNFQAPSSLIKQINEHGNTNNESQAINANQHTVRNGQYSLIHDWTGKKLRIA